MKVDVYKNKQVKMAFLWNLSVISHSQHLHKRQMEMCSENKVFLHL